MEYAFHHAPTITRRSFRKDLLTEENKAPTFMTFLAAKEHVLEDYTLVRIKNFLVSIEKDFRSVK